MINSFKEELSLDSSSQIKNINYIHSQDVTNSSSSKIITFLVNKKIIKNESRAIKIVLSFVIVLFVSTVLLIYKNNTHTLKIEKGVFLIEKEY